MNNKVKIQDVQDHMQFTIPDREGVWVNTGKHQGPTGKEYCYCKRMEDGLLMVDYQYIEADTMVTIQGANCRDEQHEQAWTEIQCTEECMKEEARVLTENGIGEEVNGWESYEEAQQRKEMQKKVEDELGVMTGNWAENAINMTQKYKDAGVKDPIEAGIEATIKGLTDMPTSRTVPVFHDHVEGEPGRVEEYGASMYLQDESAVQQSIIQSYEQYMNPPDAEIYQSLVDRLRPLQEYENMKMCIRLKYQENSYAEIDWEKSCIAIMKEKMKIEQKILKWYNTHRDEEFRELFDISVDRQGKIE